MVSAKTDTHSFLFFSLLVIMLMTVSACVFKSAAIQSTPSLIDTDAGSVLRPTVEISFSSEAEIISSAEHVNTAEESENSSDHTEHSPSEEESINIETSGPTEAIRPTVVSPQK